MQTANKIHIAMGLVGMAVGTIPLLAWLGVLPTRPPQPGDAPAWIAGAVGLAFFLAGVIAMLRGLAGASDSAGELPDTAPRPLRAANDLLAMPIPVLLALIFTWIAFGRGERHFSVAAGDGSSAVAMGHGAGGDIIGRIAFGFGAVLGWVLVGWMILSLARRWFRLPPDCDPGFGGQDPQR